jgi:hypothetical protein
MQAVVVIGVVGLALLLALVAAQWFLDHEDKENPRQSGGEVEGEVPVPFGVQPNGR